MGDEAGTPGAGAPDAGTQVVGFWFPVEVEVVGNPDETLVKRIAAEVIAEFDRELESRQ